MAFEIVNVAASVWQERGLRYLLMPEDLAEDGKSAPAFGEAPQNHEQRRPQRPRPPVQERVASPESAPPRRAAEWKPIPLAEWPAVWREQFERAKRGKVVWTYADLGMDLRAGKNPDPGEAAEAAQARARRSQALRSLIGALKYPPGTHTFWPCRLDDELSPDLFWSGARLLGSRGVIILGQECAGRLLGAIQTRPFTGKIFRGQKVAVLRALAEYRDADAEQVVAFLRSSLAQIVR